MNGIEKNPVGYSESDDVLMPRKGKHSTHSLRKVKEAKVLKIPQMRFIILYNFCSVVQSLQVQNYFCRVLFYP